MRCNSRADPYGLVGHSQSMQSAPLVYVSMESRWMNRSHRAGVCIHVHGADRREVDVVLTQRVVVVGVAGMAQGDDATCCAHDKFICLLYRRE